MLDFDVFFRFLKKLGFSQPFSSPEPDTQSTLVS